MITEQDVKHIQMACHVDTVFTFILLYWDSMTAKRETGRIIDSKVIFKCVADLSPLSWWGLWLFSPGLLWAELRVPYNITYNQTRCSVPGKVLLCVWFVLESNSWLKKDRKRYRFTHWHVFMAPHCVWRWFNGFNWEGLKARTLPSPLKREVSGDINLCGF